MSCPTCGHTLEKVVDHVHHCPRCGTMAVQWAGNSRPDTYVPKLVDRCRRFRKSFDKTCVSAIYTDWHRLGIAEAISPPEDRPVP